MCISFVFVHGGASVSSSECENQDCSREHNGGMREREIKRETLRERERDMYYCMFFTPRPVYVYVCLLGIGKSIRSLGKKSVKCIISSLFVKHPVFQDNGRVYKNQIHMRLVQQTR